ncbi:hypothetical protein CesoFtcFv8_007886 [Champsocephalus esox]|uniref:Uncharacterized protein n=1 Tax=Champsocephalus esox TaxID=159716 RepID=A0AAN8CF13_9TELE|nr:hypothetical protein CesoFtcFv8_007886 [Champsocephalus esox]
MRARLSQQRGEKVTALLRHVTPRREVTALSVMQLLDMISAGHVVIPLGLLHSEETPGGLFACASTHTSKWTAFRVVCREKPGPRWPPCLVLSFLQLLLDRNWLIAR